MTYLVEIADEAYFDIEEAFLYYEEASSKRIVRRFAAQIRKGIKYIRLYPLHLAVKYNETRIYNLENFPYQIHFLVQGDVVKVLRVFHGSSDPSSWEDRL